jgi:hypothetical protein
MDVKDGLLGQETLMDVRDGPFGQKTLALSSQVVATGRKEEHLWAVLRRESVHKVYWGWDYMLAAEETALGPAVGRPEEGDILVDNLAALVQNQQAELTL